MSVEADTMRHYAAIDREQARDAAIEYRATDESEAIDASVYGWLMERFGENVAIALTDPDGYSDADVLETIRDGREHFTNWRDAKATRRATEYLEG